MPQDHGGIALCSRMTLKSSVDDLDGN